MTIPSQRSDYSPGRLRGLKTVKDELDVKARSASPPPRVLASLTCGSLDDEEEALVVATSADTGVSDKEVVSKALDLPDTHEPAADGVHVEEGQGGAGAERAELGQGGELEKEKGKTGGKGEGDESPRVIQLRVGIHTGEVASGVVGIHVPRFKLFGETVCAAARLEASGTPGRVHCSRETADILAEHGYEVESRGPIILKGLQNMSSYWVQNVPGEVQKRVEDAVASARRQLDLLRAYKEKVRAFSTHICTRVRCLP